MAIIPKLNNSPFHKPLFGSFANNPFSSSSHSSGRDSSENSPPEDSEQETVSPEAQPEIFSSPMPGHWLSTASDPPNIDNTNELEQDPTSSVREEPASTGSEPTVPKPMHSIWDDQFMPVQPKNIAETGLNTVIVEDLALKIMLSKGVITGRQLAQSTCLHYNIVEELLSDLKARMLVGHKSTAGINDFLFTLTDLGREKALMAREITGYAGPAPVPFAAYLESVKAQSIRKEQPGYRQLRAAFKDLVLDDTMFDTLGPAVNSARGLFLYGEPGNGKTSIAERITQCFQQPIYIPRAIWVEGQIIQLFDLQNHNPVQPVEASYPAGQDPRWVLIHRPIVMVGGELTLDALDITYNALQKVSEAPLQMKANGGTFLIDDFGRQRVSTVDLLNRWIVPLEKRVDFLVLPTGKKIEVPFDQLIIFSTNLNPHELVDEAFLRRIPYKIHVQSPSEETFKNLFRVIAPRYRFSPEASTFETLVEYLIATHYRGKRPFRACQARDILEQVVNACNYRGQPPTLSEELLDKACANYFAAMGG